MNIPTKSFYISIGIALLCVFDAFSTLTIINAGGIELNYIMKVCIEMGVAVFFNVKFGITFIGLIILNLFCKEKVFNYFYGYQVLLVVLYFYLFLTCYETTILLQIFRG